MSETIAARHSKVYERARQEFNCIQATLRDERTQCLQDRRFYSIAGAQWEGPLQDQFANKPRFEANMIQLAITRVFNEYRNNRMAASFIPKDGSKNDELADTVDGLFRADQQDSVAEEAHDNGFDEGVGGGFGAWRLRAEYEDSDNPDDERQRICIEPIFDADSSVFFDLNAKRQDKADATKCFVLYSVTRKSFIEEWGDDPATWPKEIHQNEFDWATPDVVYVAEYYEVEIKNTSVYFYQGLDGEVEEYTQKEFDDDEGLQDRLGAVGHVLVATKKRKERKVHKYLMSGNGILEDCGYIAGKCIPVVPFYGKRWFVDNVERCSGITRIPKDMQRLLNMQLSKLGEIAGISTVEKPIFTPEQMQGHTETWANDNLMNNPYLLINPMTDASGQIVAAGPIGYTKSPSIPAATAAILQITTQMTQDLLGNQQAGEQLTPNVSGKAIELVQNKLDMQAFIYMDNMSKAIKREGEIWLSMAKDLYTVDERKMKSIDYSGAVSSVTMMNPVMENGVATFDNDLNDADFDVQVTVGASSESRRAATVRALTGMMMITDDPQTKQVLTSMAMMNMEGEGIEDVRDFFRQRLIRMGVVKPTPEEQQQLMAEMQNQRPDAQQEFLQAAAQEAISKAKQNNAATVKTLADADKSVSETAKNYASIGETAKKNRIDAIHSFATLNLDAAAAARDAAEAQNIQ